MKGLIIPRHGSRRLVAVGLVAAGLGTLAAPVAADAAPQPVATQAWLQDLFGQLPVPLSELAPAQLTGLLDQVAAADPTGSLPMVVAQLSAAQITSLATLEGGLTQVTDGLGTIVTSLLAGQPSAGQVDLVVDQLNAILAGGIPTDPSQLQDLQTILTGLPTLLQTPGVDAGGLQALQGTVAGLLGVVPGGQTGTTPGGTGTNLVPSLTSLLNVRPSGGGTTSTGSRPSTGSSTGAGAGSGVAGATSSRFRARVSRVRVSKDNRVVRARLTCPASAPSCVVGVTFTGAGKTSKPRFYGMHSSTTKAIRLRVPKGVAKRLTRRGGKVKLTAATVGSSLSAVSKRARAHRN